MTTLRFWPGLRLRDWLDWSDLLLILDVVLLDVLDSDLDLDAPVLDAVLLDALDEGLDALVLGTPANRTLLGLVLVLVCLDVNLDALILLVALELDGLVFLD